MSKIKVISLKGLIRRLGTNDATFRSTLKRAGVELDKVSFFIHGKHGHMRVFTRKNAAIVVRAFKEFRNGKGRPNDSIVEAKRA